jgi:hypothetical protein
MRAPVGNERAAVRVETIRRLLENYPDLLANNFVVVTERSVRLART